MLAGRRDMKLLMAVCFAGMFNLYVVLTVLPLYVVELGGTGFHAGLQSAAGLLTAVALRLYFGPLTDRRGRRLVLLIGTVAFALAPLGFWLAPSVEAVVFMRLLQAVGPAALLGALSALAVDLSPPSLRATGLGLSGVFKSLGAAAGPPVAIWLANAYGFPAVFAVSTAVGLVGIVCSWLLTNDDPRRSAPARGHAAGDAARDAADAAKSPAAEANGAGWLRPWREVLVPLPARFAALTVIIVALSQGAIVTFVPLYSEALGVAYHSLYFFALSSFGMLGGLVAGGLSDRFGRVRVLVPTLFLFGAGVVALAWFGSPWAAFASAVLAGFGFTGNLVILGTFMADNVSAGRTGIVFHLQESAVDVGMGIGSFVLGLTTQSLGFGASFLGVGAVCLLWGVLVLARSSALQR